MWQPLAEACAFRAKAISTAAKAVRMIMLLSKNASLRGGLCAILALVAARMMQGLSIGVLKPDGRDTVESVRVSSAGVVRLILRLTLAIARAQLRCPKSLRAILSSVPILANRYVLHPHL